MRHKKIIFFGGVGSPTAFGGELTKNKEMIARLDELGCNVTVIDSFRARSNKMKLAKILLRFFGCVLWYPKATFIFSTSFGNIYPLFKILYRLPVKLHIVYWVIGGTFAERISEGVYSSKYMKVIHLFIVEGMKMKKRMIELGFNNICYKPNFKSVGVLPKIQKNNDGRIYFIFLSRIVPDKGCRYILQCVNRLNKSGLSDKYVVDFYGNMAEEYRLEFEKEVDSAVNVSYYGSLKLQDNNNYKILAHYHYMLFPTYWFGEGFPGVVIDAYKAGVPIIGSDWNLNPEFINDGVTGIVVPTHSPEKLYKAMKDVISGKYDNENMSENCQKVVLKYDTKNVIDNDLLDIITQDVKRTF